MILIPRPRVLKVARLREGLLMLHPDQWLFGLGEWDGRAHAEERFDSVLAFPFFHLFFFLHDLFTQLAELAVAELALIVTESNHSSVEMPSITQSRRYSN